MLREWERDQRNVFRFPSPAAPYLIYVESPLEACFPSRSGSSCVSPSPEGEGEGKGVRTLWLENHPTRLGFDTSHGSC